jgi:LAS seventeen-binding protein 5
MAVGIAGDEPLLERLRILASDPTTDSQVKRKAVELFASWSVNFRDQQGMERLVALRSEMPTKVNNYF